VVTVRTVGRNGYADDPKRDLSATPSTPLGDVDVDVDGAGDRGRILSVA
jgi:hypothetical protein